MNQVLGSPAVGRGDVVDGEKKMTAGGLGGDLSGEVGGPVFHGAAGSWG